jgi:DNA-binding NarL/FixJ family response regulator
VDNNEPSVRRENAMRVLIADDHRLVVEGVKLKLGELGNDIEFTVAEDVNSLMEALRQQEPDVALIDLAMPGAEQARHLGEVRRMHPKLPILVLSGSEDPAVMKRVLDMGVNGFVPKAYSPDVMLSAVRLVMAGGIYVPPMALQPRQHHEETDPASLSNVNGSLDERMRERLQSLLTDRQMDVLRLLSQGKPNKVIARDLGISEGTVKIHLAAIFRALNVRNRVEAVVAAQHIGEL